MTFLDYPPFELCGDCPARNACDDFAKNRAVLGAYILMNEDDKPVSDPATVRVDYCLEKLTVGEVTLSLLCADRHYGGECDKKVINWSLGENNEPEPNRRSD